MKDIKPVQMIINGILDLHTFQPKEIGSLIPDYLDACREKGILEVRIIHGKGKGILRRSVHLILSRLSYVDSFYIADEQRGGWGATIVILKPLFKD